MLTTADAVGAAADAAVTTAHGIHMYISHIQWLQSLVMLYENSFDQLQNNGRGEHSLNGKFKWNDGQHQGTNH